MPVADKLGHPIYANLILAEAASHRVWIPPEKKTGAGIERKDGTKYRIQGDGSYRREAVKLSKADRKRYRKMNRTIRFQAQTSPP